MDTKHLHRNELSNQSSESSGQTQLPKSNEKSVSTSTSFKYNPAVKYLGFSLLLAYHYVLWFNPESFYPIPLLDEMVTIGWISNLLGTCIAMIIVAVLLKRSKHLSDIKGLDKIIPLVLIAMTLVLESVAPSVGNKTLLYTASMAAGAVEGLMLILWGESLIRSNAKFSVIHIGATFGCTLFASMVLGLIMPGFATPVYSVLLVAISGILLILQSRAFENDYVTLLPKKASKPARNTVAVVCMIGFVTSITCYYLTAIIPWESMPTQIFTFTIGVPSTGNCLFSRVYIKHGPLYYFLHWCFMYLVTHRNITNYVFRNPHAKRILLPRYRFYLIGSIGSIRHSYW